MNKLILLLLCLFIWNRINAQQLSNVQKNNLKILTGMEKLPSGENALKVMCKSYNYEEKFGEFIKAKYIKDSIVYEYNFLGQIIHFVEYNLVREREETNIQFKYDKNNFLIEEFDLINNYPRSKYKNDISGKVIIKYDYDSDGKEISSTSFQYGASGRIIRKGVNGGWLSSYKYDTKNIIEEVKTADSGRKDIFTDRYSQENLIEQTKIIYDVDGEILWRYNGGYKHFIFEYTNNNNNNWISRDTYKVADGDVNSKKKIEITERIFY